MPNTTERIELLEKWEQFVNEEFWPKLEFFITLLKKVLKDSQELQRQGILTIKDVELSKTMVHTIELGISKGSLFDGSTVTKKVKEEIGCGELMPLIAGSMLHDTLEVFSHVYSHFCWLEKVLKGEVSKSGIKKLLDYGDIKFEEDIEKRLISESGFNQRMKQAFESFESSEYKRVGYFGKRYSSLQEVISGVLEGILESSPKISGKVEIAECIDIWKDVIPYEDILRLEVLYELIRNAATAMQNTGGTIVLKIDKRDGMFFITVQDNGPGIPEENLSRIFEKGFTTKKNGTGLGLYYTKQLVENVMGGSIKVESTLGRGTTFTITIPEKDKGR